ncbi:hypothetical protein [Sphingobacterium daejeonense]|nr:Transposase and inactivated derivatives [Sphingobacterium daejeonense]
MIYTTNTIEGFHRQVRKVTKTKGAFTSDIALLKLIYLAHNNIKKKWTMPLANWGNNSTEISNLVSGKNGVRFAIRKMVELPPRGAVIQPLTQFILHSRRSLFGEGASPFSSFPNYRLQMETVLKFFTQFEFIGGF